MNTDFSKVNFYLVQNHEGLFFRAKGYGGSGNSWVKEPEKARTYSRIGPARSCVTFFSASEKYPAPVIVKLSIGQVEYIDEKERLQKIKEKNKKQQKRQDAAYKKWQLEMAEREIKEAEEKIRILKGIK
jgi:hypothetical protein